MTKPPGRLTLAETTALIAKAALADALLSRLARQASDLEAEAVNILAKVRLVIAAAERRGELPRGVTVDDAMAAVTRAVDAAVQSEDTRRRALLANDGTP